QSMDGPQTRSPWPACFPSRAGLMSAPHPVRRAWRCPSRLPPLVDFPQEHRDAQPFARGLAWEKLALSLRQMVTLAVMLRALMRQEACPYKHRVLAVLLTQGIHTFVQVGEPLHPDGLAKQIELAVVGLGEFAEDHPGCSVRRCRGEEFLKGRGHGMENVIGKLRWPREIDLQASISKLLGPQENYHPLRGEFVLPRFYARVLYVLRKLGKHKCPITGCRRKCFDLLDGVV